MGEEKNGAKAAKWKVIGTIIVAMIGVYGSVLATWMTSKTSDTGDALQATVEQLNTHVIPGIQRLVDDLKTENRILRAENKDINEKTATLRERLVRVETIVDPHVAKPSFLTRFMKKEEPEEDPVLVEITAPRMQPKPIPRLQIQQLAE